MASKQPDIKQLDTVLSKHILNKDYVKIKRTVKEGDADISGFLLKTSKKFILLQKEEEFYLNGYAITLKDHFDKIRCNKWDKTFKKILKAEGITDKFFGIDHNINLTSWQSIFTDLKKHDYHVIVECEDLEEPLFIIGPIKRVNKDSVSIQYYDPSGLLDKKLTVIKFPDITLVKFGDRYMDVFRKYLHKPS